MSDLRTDIAKVINPVAFDVGNTGVQEAACEKADAIVALLPQWKPIESAPKDGTPIFVCNQNIYKPRIGQWEKQTYNGVWKCATYQTKLRYVPTNWMPLPPSPEK